MTSLVDTRIRCFLKNKAQLIRNQGVFHSGSSPNNAVPPEILVSRLKKLDWNPGDIARELCMQIISLATSKGFSFPCSSLLISSGLEKKKKRWKNTGYRFPCVTYYGGGILLTGDGNFCPWIRLGQVPVETFRTGLQYSGFV